MSSFNTSRVRHAVRSLIPAAAASATVFSTLLLSACGGSSSAPAQQPSQSTVTMSGVVAASGLVPGGTTGDPTIKAGYYQGAIVCVDQNANGRCDSGEPQATTDASGRFSITTSATGALLADIGTTATNTATAAPVTSRLALRVGADQVNAAATAVVISPMSSEVQRLVEANNASFALEKAAVATRLGVTADVLADVNSISGTDQAAMLTEYNALTNRYTYATLKFDRGDKYPDALAVAGGDPEITGMTGVTAGTATTTDSRQPITFLQAQQAAFNVEGIPRYDAIFIVMLENKGTSTIAGSPYAPNINELLNTGNQLTTYFSTGNPSEPNYTALGGGDDWGITDDNWWGCGSVGGNEPTDKGFSGGTASDGQPLPAFPALPVATVTDSTGKSHSLSPGGTACVTAPSATNVNHNIQADSLFTLISKAGLTWRTYNESMNPGQDPRTDSSGDPAVSGTYVGAGSDDLKAYVTPDGLYKTKHHPGMAYQTTRNLPEFFADNRTIFGTQYGSALAMSSIYPVPAGYNYDQFSTDLATGDVGNLNFVVPDQCDDMHGVGSDPSCAGNYLILRGDDYVRQVVETIEASPLWNNPHKRIAIVLMFDEGKATFSNATSPYNSCCGWVPGAAASLVNTNPLTVDASGAVAVNTSIADYGTGNHGHGNSIFGVLTNQPGAKSIKDSDVYSHFSFVRTLQDMFQIADPTQDGTYLARARYTEKFIAQNILNLPEYAGSADTHFDSVRPMNHAYVIPAGYTQKQSNDIATAPQVGPDANQTSVWAVQ